MRLVSVDRLYLKQVEATVVVRACQQLVALTHYTAYEETSSHNSYLKHNFVNEHT